MRERESWIEMQLWKAAEKAGGQAFKFVSPGAVGVPDRIVVLPGGITCFVEVKAPGEKPRPVQRAVLRKLYRMGARVAVVDNEVSARNLIDMMRRRRDEIFSARLSEKSH